MGGQLGGQTFALYGSRVWKCENSFSFILSTFEWMRFYGFITDLYRIRARHGMYTFDARLFAASGAFRMSALAASGAALESFRRPQQPRRREEVRRRERESGAVATSP